MKKTLTIILILLAVHLLYTNTNLLLVFVEQKTTLNDVLRLLFAGSYSAITVLILAIYPKRHVFLLSGLLDGTSVLLQYLPMQPHTQQSLTAVYFSLYTMFIVIIAGEITKKNETKTTLNETENKKNEIKTKENGVSDYEKKYNELLKKRTSIKNALNRIKNDEKRRLRRQELDEVEYQLKQLADNFS